MSPDYCKPAKLGQKAPCRQGFADASLLSPCYWLRGATAETEGNRRQQKEKSGASDPAVRPAKSLRVRGKATVNSKKVGGPTFVGPWV
jgi:hypothetical protein